MPDIRSQVSSDMGGKLIYQLTSASALKDTDLFPISSSDNLTRNVSLGQIKASFNIDYYNKDDIDIVLDMLRQQIKNISDDLFNLGNDVTEFRNEFNNKLNELDNSLRYEINEIDKKFTNITNDLDTKFTNITNDLDTRITEVHTELDTKIDTEISNLDTTLSKKISDLDAELTKMITEWILYGTAVPATLATGRVYLQYF